MTLADRFELAALRGISPDTLTDRLRRDPNSPSPIVKGRPGGQRNRKMTQWDKDEILHWHANRPRRRRPNAQGSSQRSNTLDNTWAQAFIRRPFLTREETL